MTQFHATSFISAWHFLHERLWVRPKASFDKVFVATVTTYCSLHLTLRPEAKPRFNEPPTKNQSYAFELSERRRNHLSKPINQNGWPRAGNCATDGAPTPTCLATCTDLL